MGGDQVVPQVPEFGDVSKLQGLGAVLGARGCGGHQGFSRPWGPIQGSLAAVVTPIDWGETQSWFLTWGCE